MPLIYVKTKEGRRAFNEGREIPSTEFVPVTETPYIRRLIDHHGDLEEEKGKRDTNPRKPDRNEPEQSPPKTASAPVRDKS